MSWMYFADLRLSVPAAAWEFVLAQRPSEVQLPPRWSGLRDQGLEAALGSFDTDSGTFATVLAWPCYHPPGAIHETRIGQERVDLRVCTTLEKSVLAHGHPLATLLHAARSAHGSGTLLLISDGTGGGVEGVRLTLENGAITHESIDERWDLLEKVGTELYGGGVAVEPADRKTGDGREGEP